MVETSSKADKEKERRWEAENIVKRAIGDTKEFKKMVDSVIGYLKEAEEEAARMLQGEK